LFDFEKWTLGKIIVTPWEFESKKGVFLVKDDKLVPGGFSRKNKIKGFLCRL